MRKAYVSKGMLVHNKEAQLYSRRVEMIESFLTKKNLILLIENKPNDELLSSVCLLALL